MVDAIAEWQQRALPVRSVPRENLHVTLAFLGSRPVGERPSIAAAVRAAVADAEQPLLRINGYRETRSVGMLTLHDEGASASAIAHALFDGLEALGVYRRERRTWLPHITVVRFRERLRLRPELPVIPPFRPSDAAVYLSRLRRSGAQYVVLESFALGG